jgi:thiamine-phosphate pyrophosphorylase
MIVHALVDDLDTARRAVDAGATVVQLRVKGPTSEIVERGRGFRKLGVAFVVNDDVDAALALGADGVHLGQADEGAERAWSAGLLLGRSATNLAEAVATDADYLGVGPVWDTPSKADAAAPIGLEALAEICAAVDVPVVAIGGIDAANAAACIHAGAAGVAVVRAAADPSLRRAVDEALRAR